MIEWLVSLRCTRLLGLAACFGVIALNCACAGSGRLDEPNSSTTDPAKRWEVHDDRGVEDIPSDAIWIAAYDATDELIRKVCAFSRIETLEVYAAGSQGLTDLSMERISSNLKHLRTLEVIDAPLVGDQGLRSVARVPQLRRLVLRDGCVTRSVIECLSAADSLQELVLEELLDDAALGLPILAEKLNLTTLEIQSVAGLTDELLQSVANISTLRRLRINTCVEFTGATLASLATTCRIEYLDLSFNRSLAVTTLAHVARFPELKSLTLQYCPTIDAASLEDLATAPKLAELDLYGCQGVQDDAIRYLLELRALKSLVVTRTGMTAQGVEEIRGHLKDGRVYG